MRASYGITEDWFAAPRDVMPQAEAASQKALELDPNLGDAVGEAAYAEHFYEFNHSKAVEGVQHAVELDVNDASIHGIYGWCLMRAERGWPRFRQ